jgi:hypothetical protein
MPEISFRALIIGGFVLIVSSVASGYFFSIGADLWQITRPQLNEANLQTLFWLISVPIGVIGTVLLILALMKTHALGMPQRIGKHEVVGKNLEQTALDFWVTSTTDWFEIGIENGKLHVVGRPRFETGSSEPPAVGVNYFHINHSKSPSLKMKISATFNLQRKKPICVLRKGDIGHLYVQVTTTGFWWTYLGKWEYSRSPNNKNEVTFPLYPI